MTEINVTNPIISLSINAARGNSIASLRVLGVETVDTNDLGRGIQASVYFPTGSPGESLCAGVDKHWMNLQSAGNDENVAARICLQPSKDERTVTIAAYPQMSPSGGELWENEPGQHFCIHTTYALGPLPAVPFPEVVQLVYRFRASQKLQFSHLVCDQRDSPTIVPLIPLAFFKADILSRLFGLDERTGQWQEYQPRADTVYHPLQYRQRAMAWMRPDLGWGVALHGPWTLSDSASDNFTAQSFPDYRVNQLCLVDQSLNTISPSQDEQYDASTQRTAYLIVGNIKTISQIIDCIERT